MPDIEETDSGHVYKLVTLDDKGDHPSNCIGA